MKLGALLFVILLPGFLATTVFAPMGASPDGSNRPGASPERSTEMAGERAMTREFAREMPQTMYQMCEIWGRWPRP